MTDDRERAEQDRKAQEQIVVQVLRGYCGNIPAAVVDQIIAIYHRYGLWPALEAALAVVKVSGSSS